MLIAEKLILTNVHHTPFLRLKLLKLCYFSSSAFSLSPNCKNLLGLINFFSCEVREN